MSINLDEASTCSAEAYARSLGARITWRRDCAVADGFPAPGALKSFTTWLKEREYDFAVVGATVRYTAPSFQQHVRNDPVLKRARVEALSGTAA